MKLSVDVVTPLVVQLTVLTSKLWVLLSNFTLIDVDVPMPTESLGTTFKFIISPSTKLCAVETDTTVSTLCNLPVTFVFCANKLYSKLLDPTLLCPTNAKPCDDVVKPTWVTIPTVSLDFLIMNTSWLSPDSGILNVVTPSSLVTVRA